MKECQAVEEEDDISSSETKAEQTGEMSLHYLLNKIMNCTISKYKFLHHFL